MTSAGRVAGDLGNCANACGKPAEGTIDLRILGPTPFCKGCAERYLRVVKRHRGPGDPGPGKYREAGLLDEWYRWQQRRAEQGILGVGGDKDLEDFASDYEVGSRGLQMLRRQLWGSQKQAWSGWGPSLASAKQHHVDGWDWDKRLSAYVATAVPESFLCKCGAKLSVPGYHNCKCGKIWNSYVIGTGGENRQAAVEKFLCREVPVRDNVIVAGRKVGFVPPLNVSPSAPPREKPVILVYGGGFNPPHKGHAGALVDAHGVLSNAGYKVEGSIVVPTADKLLAKKLGLPDRLSLQARANLARVGFPTEINGTPVIVHTEPSEEVERAVGIKPRRSDLARWVQRQYPNHTVINVTGEDAAVPGAPDMHPSLYSGELGSHHEGYSYLTMPRDLAVSISSSKIRAAEAAGEPIPGMTPEAERAYRDELARHRATLPKTASCNCWKGYERVPGTKPCAEGSCRKCDGHRKKKSSKDNCPACGRGIRDYDLSGVEDHRGQRWCHDCLPDGIKSQMDVERDKSKKKKSNLFDAVATRAEGKEEDYASDEFPSDHHPDTSNKMKSTPKDWYHRDKNQRWTAR